jgi:PiT family inorganic phosphate transporter
MALFLMAAVVLFLSFANGSNDDFKGVATLLGSGTTNYRKALLWG